MRRLPKGAMKGAINPTGFTVVVRGVKDPGEVHSDQRAIPSAGS